MTIHAETSDFRLGVWRVRPTLNRIEHEADFIALEPKVMRLLVFLSEHYGEVLTRDVIITTIWNGNHVVDGALTRAIYELRKALSSHGGATEYIETVRQVGYRLAIPPQPWAEEADRQVPLTDLKKNTPPLAAIGKNITPTRLISGFLAAGVVLASGYVLLLKTREQRAAPDDAAESQSAALTSFGAFQPLTSYPGVEESPAVSPSGKFVSFVKYNSEKDVSTIFEIELAAAHSRVLTSTQGRITGLTWAPADDSIAYANVLSSGVDERRCAVNTYSKITDETNQLLDCFDSDSVQLDWSPVTDALAVAWKPHSDKPHEVALFHTETGEKIKSVVRELPTFSGLCYPKFSPDGTQLAIGTEPLILRGTVQIFDVETTALVSEVEIGGEIAGLDWIHNGAAIAVTTRENNIVRSWVVSQNRKSEAPELRANFSELVSSDSGEIIVGTNQSSNYNIARIDTNALSSSVEPLSSLSSTGNDYYPILSPSGDFIAFMSLRTGVRELFLCAVDCNSPRQLTDISVAGATTIGRPSWSPDARNVAFAVGREGVANIHVFEVETGRITQITTGDHQDVLPSWSRDGKAILFGSDRDGPWSIWKATIPEFNIMRVSQGEGLTAYELTDGRILIADCNALTVRVEAVDGSSTFLSRALQAETCGKMHQTKNGSVFFAEQYDGKMRIMKFDSDNKLTVFSTMLGPHDYDGGFSVHEETDLFLTSFRQSNEADLFIAKKNSR